MAKHNKTDRPVVEALPEVDEDALLLALQKAAIQVEDELDLEVTIKIRPGGMMRQHYEQMREWFEEGHRLREPYDLAIFVDYEPELDAYTSPYADADE